MRNCVTPKAEGLTAIQIRLLCLGIETTGPLVDAATPRTALADPFTPTRYGLNGTPRVCGKIF